jgi:hypothetical protein
MALLENGFVLLPGSGVFYLLRYPARIDNGLESISPPGFTVDFVPSTYISDYYLAYFIAEKSSGDFHFWNEKLKEYSKEISQIEIGGRFNMEQLGFFYKDDSGKLHYESNGLEDIIGLNSLAVLPCKPLPLHFKAENKAPSEEEVAKSQSQPVVIKNEQKNRKKLSALGWFLLILGAVLLFALLYDRCSVSNLVEIDPPPHISQDRFNQPPDKLYVDSFQKEDSNKFENEYYQFEEGQDSDIDFYDDAAENNEYESSAFEQEQEPISEDEPTSSDSETIASENDYVIVSGRCVIITGSFSRDSNIKNQRTRLENLGYSVYTENIGNLTRVGVLVDCKEANLKSELSYIRANIESAAWIMEEN